MLGSGKAFHRWNDELKGFVYAAGLPNSSQDLFFKTTQEIAKYVAREIPNAGEFRIAMLNMDMPELTKPTNPADKDDIEEVETYKLELKD